MNHIRVIGVAALMMLQGCAMTSTIKEDAVSYEGAIEDLTDKFIVENVLRARDRAPQHFVDIPQIHETLQTSATLAATDPWGPHNGGNARATATATLGVQTNPSFDVVHLDSKDFVTGIASPIDAKFMKYWLDRGIDSRMLMLLFVSSIQITKTISGVPVAHITVKNSPRESLFAIEQEEWNLQYSDTATPCGSSDFGRFLRVVNSLRHFSANVYRAKTQLAADQKLDFSAQLKDITSLDPTKFSIERNESGTYDIYVLSSTDQVALCYGADEQKPKRQAFVPSPTTTSQGDACTESTVVRPLPKVLNAATAAASAAAAAAAKAKEAVYYAPQVVSVDADRRVEISPKSGYCSVFEGYIKSGDDYTVSMSVRSTGEVIQFLGDLLAYQDALNEFKSSRNASGKVIGELRRHSTPVTLSYCDIPGMAFDSVQCPLGAGGGGALFELNGQGTQRFQLTYRNQPYWVNQASSTDHTLEVLAVVHQLIDLNKSATDIRSTPFVQLLP